MKPKSVERKAQIRTFSKTHKNLFIQYKSLSTLINKKNKNNKKKLRGMHVRTRKNNKSQVNKS